MRAWTLTPCCVIYSRLCRVLTQTGAGMCSFIHKGHVSWMTTRAVFRTAHQTSLLNADLNDKYEILSHSCVCTSENWTLSLAQSNPSIFSFFWYVEADVHFPLKYLECVENFRIWRSWPLFTPHSCWDQCWFHVRQWRLTAAHTSLPGVTGQGLVLQRNNEMQPARSAARKYNKVMASAVIEKTHHSNNMWQACDSFHQGELVSVL